MLLETFNRVLKTKMPLKNFYYFEKDMVYNSLSEELHKNGVIVDLGKRERAMLKLFIRNTNKTVTKEEIIATIWEMEEVTESALKNLFNRLKTKIGSEFIVSVKGRGWRLSTQA